MRLINKEQYMDTFAVHCRNVCKPASGNESKTCYFREAICRARWLIHLYFLYTSQFSGNQIFLRIRSTTSCERSDAFKFPLITVVDSIK